MQDQAQERISNYTSSVLKEGISTNDGMYGVLKNGSFLERPLKKPQFEIQTSFENIVRLKLLAAVLRAQVRRFRLAFKYTFWPPLIHLLVRRPRTSISPEEA